VLTSDPIHRLSAYMIYLMLSDVLRVLLLVAMVVFRLCLTLQGYRATDIRCASAHVPHSSSACTIGSIVTAARVTDK